MKKKEQPKQVKGQQAVENQSLMKSMDASKNLFSQFSAQYLMSRDELSSREDVQQFISKQELKTQDFFHSFDQDTQRILHGLGKKSETTKLKALSELKLLLTNSEPDFFITLTPTYINIFIQYVSSEHEREILEEASNVLEVIGQKNKKSLQPHFKTLFPHWYILINDPNQDVSQAALKAFSVFIPKEKQGAAVTLCQDQYFNNLKFYLKFTPKTLQQENMNITESQAEHIYERLQISALRSITTALKWIQSQKPEEINSFAIELMKNKQMLIDLLDVNKKRPAVISAIIDAFSSLLSSECTKPSMTENLEVIAQRTLLKYLDDRERGIQQALWRGYIAILVRLMTPEGMHKLDPQQLETKTLETVKRAAMGVGKPFYDQLIVLFAHLPPAAVFDIQKPEVFKQRLAFIRKFLDALLQGGTAHEESRFFCDQAVNCYFEIAFFAIQKRMIPIVEKSLADKAHCKKTARDLLLAPMTAFLQRHPNQQNVYNYNPFKQAPSSFAQILMTASQSPLMIEFLADTVDTLSASINFNDQVSFNNFLQIVEQLVAKTKDSCVVYKEVKRLVAGVATSLLSLENLEMKDPEKTLQNLDNLLGLLGIFVANQNEFLKDNYPDFANIDHFRRIVQQCLQDLFVQIQFGLSHQVIIRYCSLISTLQERLSILIERYEAQKQWNPTFEFLTKQLEEEKLTVIPKEKQLNFKLKLVCFFQLAVSNIPHSYYINFLSVKGESVQEWQLLESEVLKLKDHLQPLPQEKARFMDLLLQKTYAIQNMSLKIFLPAIYYTLQQQHLFIEKINQVSQTLISLPIDCINYQVKFLLAPKFKPWFGVYEELFYLGTQLQIHSEEAPKIYAYIFQILWVIFRNKQSQKANRLLQIFNAAVRATDKKEVQVSHLIEFLEKQFSEVENIETLLAVLQALLDSTLPFIDELLQLLFSLKFYSDALVKPHIWQIIRCVHGKQTMKVESYLRELFLKEESYPLFAIMFASIHSVSVLYNHRIKRFLQNLLSNVIKPLIIDDFEQHQSIRFLLAMAQQEQQLVGVALKQLFRELLIEEKEQYGDQNCSEQMKQAIAEVVCRPLSQAKSENSVLTLRSLFNELDLRNQEINAAVRANLDCEQLVQRFLSSQNLLYLDLATILQRKSDDLGSLEDEQLLANTTNLLISLLQKECSNYKLIVFFDFINLVIERRTMVPFAEHIQSIATQFKQLFKLNQPSPSRFYSFAFITGLQFLRKILNFIEAFPGEFIDFITFSVTDSCLSFVAFCQEQSNTIIEEQNDLMFIEYAETMLRMLPIDQLFLLDDHTYYELLKAPFVSIQKAAFLTLKQFQTKKKQNKLAQSNETVLLLLQSVDLDKEEKDMITKHQLRLKEMILDGEENQQDDVDIEEILSFPLSPQKLAYLLTWVIEKNPPRELFSTYLNNLLYIHQFLQECGVSAVFSAKEIYECSVDLASIQDDQVELLKLVAISVYQFVASQQAYFKRWLAEECSRDQRRQVEYLVAEHVSKTIFLREVEGIEASQFDWQTEDFQIYVSRAIGEISAVYQKEQQKIEIVITVPPEYPLKPLRIEAKKGVKLGEDKLKRWALMIRMILQNNSDSILSAILLWKSNIDKQFEGLEECAICYYVIHQTGEIPKMNCKTCKHKFHSSCIQKWFQTSNKSECPLCKSQFL